MRSVKRWGITAVVALALAGCSSGGGTTGDAAAQLACTHFRNVAADTRAGILTDAEIRTKLAEVYSDAKLSEDAGIASGAQAMLRDATTGDTTAFSTDIDAFDASCTAVGF